MPRCLNNCHSLETFWKNWHASFNKWLVRYIFQLFIWSFPALWLILKCITENGYNHRYMYIPLGGSRRKLLNVWPIFTFVALWHDLEWYFFFPSYSFCYFICHFAVRYASKNCSPLLKSCSLVLGSFFHGHG